MACDRLCTPLRFDRKHHLVIGALLGVIGRRRIAHVLLLIAIGVIQDLGVVIGHRYQNWSKSFLFGLVSIAVLLPCVRGVHDSRRREGDRYQPVPNLKFLCEPPGEFEPILPIHMIQTVLV